MFSNFGILKMVMKIKSALALFLIFTICSCANNTSVVSDYRSSDQINKIALYIFEKSENIENLSEVDLFNFTKYFNDLFSANGIVNSDNAPEILLVNEYYKGHNQYLSEATSREDVDAYFVGNIKRYEKRVGSDLGVSSPASVHINIDLVDTKTGQIIWTYEVNETQLPLSSDVSKVKKFFNRKGKWITAENLMYEALDEIAAKFIEYIGESS